MMPHGQVSVELRRNIGAILEYRATYLHISERFLKSLQYFLYAKLDAPM